MLCCGCILFVSKMYTGSLFDCLHNGSMSTFSLVRHVDIAVDILEGVTYMHLSKMVHRGQKNTYKKQSDFMIAYI
jgi:hypothetical protein